MIISIKTREMDMEDNLPKLPTSTNQSNYTQLNTDYKNPKLLLINTIKEILPNKQKIIQILSLMTLTCVFLILASGNFSFINWGKNQQKSPMQNFTSSGVFNNDGQMATEDIYPLDNKSQILESAMLRQIKDNKRSFKYEMSGIITPEFFSNNIYSLMFSSFPISSQGYITHTQNGNFDIITNINLINLIEFDLHKLSDNIFFRLNKIPNETLDLLGIERDKMDPILKKWVYVSENKSLLKKKTGKTEEKQLQELIAYILQSTNLNLIGLANDNIDGKETIKITITQNAIDFDSLIEKMNKWYLENTGSYLYFKENDIRFSDVFEGLEANLWLDKNDHVPRKVNVLGKYKPKLDKETSNLNFLNIKNLVFAININFTETDAITIDTPNNFQTYNQYIKEMSSVLTNVILYGKRDSLFNQIINNHLFSQQTREAITEDQRVVDFTRIMQAIFQYQSDCKDFPDSLEILINANQQCNTKQNYFENFNFDPLDQKVFYYEKYTNKRGFSLCTNLIDPQKMAGYISNTPCPNPSFNTHFSSDIIGLFDIFGD